MLPGIDRVYVNRRARDDLRWQPRFDFQRALATLRSGVQPARASSGEQGYHTQTFEEGPNLVETGG